MEGSSSLSLLHAHNGCHHHGQDEKCDQDTHGHIGFPVGFAFWKAAEGGEQESPVAWSGLPPCPRPCLHHGGAGSQDTWVLSLFRAVIGLEELVEELRRGPISHPWKAWGR